MKKGVTVMIIVIALILVIAGLTYAWCDYNSREDAKQMIGELI